MFSFITEIFSDVLKDKIKPFVEKLFEKETWIAVYSRYLFLVTVIVFIGIAICALWQRLTHAIQFLSLEQITNKDETTFIDYLLRVIGNISLSISIITFLLIIVLSIIGIKKSKLTWKFAINSLLISLAILGGNVLLGKTENQLRAIVKAGKFVEAISFWNKGEFSEAINIFSGIYIDDPYSELADDALGRVGGAHYNNQNYQDAIVASARLLYEYPSSNVREETITTLHWGIYQLGKLVELDDAINFIESVKKQYPTPELSCIWIGIPPDVNEMIWSQDPFFYVAKTTVLEEEDQKKLDILVSRFPNDSYTDYGLYVLGRYDIIINEHPNSQIMEWAYYAKAKYAFVSGDFANAAIDYKDFYSKFPNSASADDAAYKAGMAYMQLGNDGQFLQEMYLSLSLPDQDMTNQVRQKLLWFADGLSSDSISNLVSSTSDPTVKELFLYTLGKEFIIENKYREARETFSLLCANPVLPEVAKHCANNLGILDFIIDHENSTPANLFAIAVFLSDKDSFYDNEILARGYGKNIGSDWVRIQLRNNNFQTISWANTLINNFPNDPSVPSAYCLIGDSYQKLSLLGSNLPSEGQAMFDGYDVYVNPPYSETHRYQYRENATVAYEQCINLSSDLDQKADAYIQRAMTYMYPPWNFERAREYFRQFVDTFPQHDAANNALMWIARTYVRDAIYVGRKDPTMKPLLLAAHATYEEVLSKYPVGHVAIEAQDELIYVERLLSEISE